MNQTQLFDYSSITATSSSSSPSKTTIPVEEFMWVISRTGNGGAEYKCKGCGDIKKTTSITAVKLKMHVESNKN